MHAYYASRTTRNYVNERLNANILGQFEGYQHLFDSVRTDSTNREDLFKRLKRKEQKFEALRMNPADNAREIHRVRSHVTTYQSQLKDAETDLNVRVANTQRGHLDDMKSKIEEFVDAHIYLCGRAMQEFTCAFQDIGRHNNQRRSVCVVHVDGLSV
jgi:chromosome segregation ATPase